MTKDSLLLPPCLASYLSPPHSFLFPLSFPLVSLFLFVTPLPPCIFSFLPVSPPSSLCLPPLSLSTSSSLYLLLPPFQSVSPFSLCLLPCTSLFQSLSPFFLCPPPFSLVLLLAPSVLVSSLDLFFPLVLPLLPMSFLFPCVSHFLPCLLLSLCVPPPLGVPLSLHVSPSSLLPPFLPGSPFFLPSSHPSSSCLPIPLCVFPSSLCLPFLPASPPPLRVFLLSLYLPLPPCPSSLHLLLPICVFLLSCVSPFLPGSPCAPCVYPFLLMSPHSSQCLPFFPASLLFPLVSPFLPMSSLCLPLFPWFSFLLLVSTPSSSCLPIHIASFPLGLLLHMSFLFPCVSHFFPYLLPPSVSLFLFMSPLPPCVSPFLPASPFFLRVSLPSSSCLPFPPCLPFFLVSSLLSCVSHSPHVSSSVLYLLLPISVSSILPVPLIAVCLLHPPSVSPFLPCVLLSNGDECWRLH